MMLHHVIALRFTEGTTDEQIQRLVDGLMGLRSRIGTIRSMRMGKDLRIRPDNFEFASLIEFDDEAGYLEFRDHPAHQQVVRDCIRPIMAERAGVVFLSS
jgi:stress responsive alpha/beta barrel protein